MGALHECDAGIPQSGHRKFLFFKYLAAYKDVLISIIDNDLYGRALHSVPILLCLGLAPLSVELGQFSGRDFLGPGGGRSPIWAAETEVLG